MHECLSSGLGLSLTGFLYASVLELETKVNPGVNLECKPAGVRVEKPRNRQAISIAACMSALAQRKRSVRSSSCMQTKPRGLG